MLATLCTWRWSARSALLPVNAMIMLGFPCRCSSFTHVFAFAKLSALLMSKTITAAAAPLPAQHIHRQALPTAAALCSPNVRLMALCSMDFIMGDASLSIAGWSRWLVSRRAALAV